MKKFVEDYAANIDQNNAAAALAAQQPGLKQK